MSVRDISPVPIEQLVDLWQPVKPWQSSAAILQAARSDSIGWLEGETLIAAALFYPRGDGVLELVFACRPQASRHMLTIVRAAQRLTRGAPADDTRIEALCRRDNHAGRRLAWLCGMRPAGIAGAFKRYERICLRHQDAVLRSRHVEAGRPNRAAASGSDDRA